MRKRSSRNGTATLRLPKNVTRPGERQPRILRERHGGIGKPPGEEDEADRQQLPGVRKVERRRDDDLRQAAARVRTPARSISVRLDSMSTGSTMKRSPATNAVMSALRVSEKMSRIRIGVSAATSPGSTHRLTSSATQHVGDQVHLQAAELLEAQRAGGGRGDGEEPVGRELDDEPGGARQRGADHVQQVEEHRLALEADDARPRGRWRTGRPPGRRCWRASRTGSPGCRGRRSRTAAGARGAWC